MGRDGVVNLVAISPNYEDTDFTYPLRLDDKITLFVDRIHGWQLDIADKCINGEKDASGTVTRPYIEGSGLVTLSIVLSYFETIAKYREGYLGSNSKTYFKKGVRLVFPDLSNYPRTVVDDILTILYYGARCGLYHSSIISSKILLTGNFHSALGYIANRRMIVINPHLLVPALKRHFQRYEQELRNPANISLRQNFEKSFDFES